MSIHVPRMRVFAGPNGSGKTTVKTNLGKPEHWFGVYINPDDIEQTIRTQKCLSLIPFQIETTIEELRQHFASSVFLKSVNQMTGIDTIQLKQQSIDFSTVPFTSYHASM